MKNIFYKKSLLICSLFLNIVFIFVLGYTKKQHKAELHIAIVENDCAKYNWINSITKAYIAGNDENFIYQVSGILGFCINGYDSHLMYARNELGVDEPSYMNSLYGVKEASILLLKQVENKNEINRNPTRREK